MNRLSHHHVAYRSSALTRPQPQPERPPTRREGPDIGLTSAQGTSRLHRLLGHGRHILVVSPVENAGRWEPPGPRPYRPFRDIASGHLPHQARAAAETTVDLIRPDGYIAAHGTPQ